MVAIPFGVMKKINLRLVLGTEKDFERYYKYNKCKIVSENEFYKELYSLPLNEQKTHIQFIREQLTIIMTYEKEIR